MTLNYADVGEILKMIDSSSCSEFVLELDGIKIVVRKDHQTSTVSEPIGVSNSVQPAISTPADSSIATDITHKPSDKPNFGGTETAKGEIIRSPMVGTFFSKPSPEEAPFVVTGQKVKKGDTLCLIEVMKLFTAVECTKDGIMETLFVENGALVEFDQPLFTIS